METKFSNAQLRKGVRGFSPFKLRPLDYIGHKCDFKLCPHDVERLAWPCSPGYVSDWIHGRRWINRCGKWDCEYCSKTKVLAYEQKVSWFQHFHTLNDTVKNVLMSLTFAGRCDVGCREHWSECIRLGHTKTAYGARGKVVKASTRENYFRRLIQRLRERFNRNGLNIEYARVKEKTRAGIDHYHVILANVSRDISAAELKAASSEMWREITGNSYITDVRDTYGKPEKYLSKYLDKDFVDGGVDPGTRRYSFSNGAMLPPTALRQYQLDYSKDRTGTPFQQAFRDSDEMIVQQRYLPKVKFTKYHAVPKEGMFRESDKCDHPECEMRLYVSMRRQESFEQSIGFERAMEDYFKLEPYEIEKLVGFENYYDEPEPYYDWTQEYEDYDTWL